MVDGLNNNEIAEGSLSVLARSIPHLKHLHKLGVDSRVEAVKMALEQSWRDPHLTSHFPTKVRWKMGSAVGRREHCRLAR